MINILAAVTLIWLLAATITDIKKREVADWLSFSLIAIAIFTALFTSIIEKDFSIIILSLISFAAFMLIANLFYYLRLFGGGDAKLLMALGPVIPQIAVKSVFNLPYLTSSAAFLLNICLLGAIYGLIYSLVLAIRNKKQFSEEIAKSKFPLIPFMIVAVIFAAISALVYPFLIFISILIVILPPVFIFVKAVESACLIKTKETKELTEGDWLAYPARIKGKGKDILITAKFGLTKKEIEILKRYKEKVVIKEGIPFVPVFLIALILTLLIGNLFELLI